jgi:hypothetical protein
MMERGNLGSVGPLPAAMLRGGFAANVGYSPMVDQMKPIMMKNPENMATRPTEP